MAVLNKPVMRVELRQGAQTEYGTPTPVVVVEFDERMHWRAGQAFMHWLAAEIDLLSVSEQWSAQLGHVSPMGKGRPQRAVLKLELGDGTIEEAMRGMTMLEHAVAAMATDKRAAILFQGDEPKVPAEKKSKPYHERIKASRRGIGPGHSNI